MKIFTPAAAAESNLPHLNYLLKYGYINMNILFQSLDTTCEPTCVSFGLHQGALAPPCSLANMTPTSHSDGLTVYCYFVTGSCARCSDIYQLDKQYTTQASQLFDLNCQPTNYLRQSRNCATARVGRYYNIPLITAVHT